MPSCIFCKIVNKQVPNYTVYEDADVLAFLDIHPHALGHTVVIPKSHVERVLDMADSDLSKVMAGVTQAVTKLEAVLRPEGYNIGWNDGAVAGQVVKHLHVHILPRYTGDAGGSIHSIVNHPGDRSVAEVAKLFGE